VVAFSAGISPKVIRGQFRVVHIDEISGLSKLPLPGRVWMLLDRGNPQQLLLYAPLRR
jgi:hypothetical protein